jgi:hypothetical protein
MRVFYIDDNELLEREYFTKIENINIPDNMKTTKIISAYSPTDLKNKICTLYGFHDSFKKDIQLWSKPLGYMGRTRLDILDKIPLDCENVYIRGVVIKETNNSI